MKFGTAAALKSETTARHKHIKKMTSRESPVYQEKTGTSMGKRRTDRKTKTQIDAPTRTRRDEYKTTDKQSSKESAPKLRRTGLMWMRVFDGRSEGFNRRVQIRAKKKNSPRVIYALVSFW